MKEITCCVCSVVFGMNDKQYANLRKCGNLFSCPNGHEQYFTDSDAVLLKKMERDRDYWYRQCKNAREERDHFERQKCGLYGYITNLKKKLR